MRLIPPRQTDAIASLAARVTALEGASYDTNSPVSMYKLFTETPKALDDFTIFTHPYHVCGTSLDVEADYPQLILGDKPVAYYRLDETSGTTVHDLSGNGNNGTISGGVTLGQPGATADGDSAMSFDGSTGYINANYSDLAITGPISIECWIKSSFLADQEWISSAQYILWNNGSGSSTTIRFADNQGNGATTTSYIPNDDNWHHVVAVFSGPKGQAVTTSNIAIYIDGASQPISVGGTWSPAAYGGTQIGCNNKTYYVDGSMDEVAIYNYALSSSQVQAHYNAGKIAPRFV